MKPATIYITPVSNETILLICKMFLQVAGLQCQDKFGCQPILDTPPWHIYIHVAHAAVGKQITSPVRYSYRRLSLSMKCVN